MEHTRDRLIRYIQDAQAAEVGIARTLEGFLDDGDNEMVRSLLRDHVAVTKNQANRLEQRLRTMGAETSAGKGFFNSLLGRVSEIMHGAHDDYDKVTQNLIKAYATEHLEIGMYTALIAYARACNDEETATLAEEILAEEEEAAERIFPLIEQCAQATYLAAVHDETRGMGYRA
jgi:ferritin-like metal-binding protein YciE